MGCVTSGSSWQWLDGGSIASDIVYDLLGVIPILKARSWLYGIPAAAKEQECAAKEAALAEIERLKAQLRDRDDQGNDEDR